MSANRILAHSGICDDFASKHVAKVASLPVGDPRAEDTVLGPLINAKQVATLHDEPIVASGGEKRPGLGRLNGEWGLGEFTILKWNSIRHTAGASSRTERPGSAVAGSCATRSSRRFNPNWT
jgi:acyl-CoA reductase-like NAD-dependent aldehyde dehydrogenase